MSKPSTDYNWAAAFIAFSQGAGLEEVADTFAIPIDRLKARAGREEWKGLATKLAIQRLDGDQSPAVVDKQTENRLALIEANRKANYEVFERLRNDLVKVVKALEADSFQVEKSWNNKGEVVVHMTGPSTGDRVNLATYARTIAEGTYAALGDRVSGLGAKEGAAEGHAPPGITIILPGAIAAPRSERGVSGVVVDMREQNPNIGTTEQKETGEAPANPIIGTSECLLTTPAEASTPAPAGPPSPEHPLDRFTRRPVQVVDVEALPEKPPAA